MSNIKSDFSVVEEVLKKCLDDLRKGDSISPSGPNGDMEVLAGQAGQGDSLQRADDGVAAAPAGIPAAQPASDADKDKDGDKKDDDKDKDKGHSEPDGDEGKSGSGDDDGDEDVAKADYEEKKTLLKAMLFDIFEELGVFDEDGSVEGSPIVKTEDGDTLRKGLEASVSGFELLKKSYSDLQEKLDSQTAIIANLTQQIEALSSRPVGPRRAFTGQALAKSEGELATGGDAGFSLSFDQSKDLLLKAQQEKRVRATDITAFEISGGKNVTPAAAAVLRSGR